MNLLSLILFNFHRSEMQFVDFSNQNWTIEMINPEQMISPTYYSLRLTKIFNNGLSAKVYHKTDDKECILSYKLIIYNPSNVSFSDQNNIIYFNLSDNINNYITKSGTFGGHKFHLFFSPEDYIRLTLFDTVNHKLINFNIWKEKENHLLPFYFRYFYACTASIIILVTKMISLWNQYRMMIAQKRLALKKRALYKSKRNQMLIDE